MMSKGHFIFRPIPCGRHMVNPLLMAMQHNKVSDANDKTLHLPDTLLTLLLADSDPNELEAKGCPHFVRL